MASIPDCTGVHALVNKGVVMVVSIGNDGPGGSPPDALFAASAPGRGRKVIGVASVRQLARLATLFGIANGTPSDTTRRRRADVANVGQPADGPHRHHDKCG